MTKDFRPGKLYVLAERYRAITGRIYPRYGIKAWETQPTYTVNIEKNGLCIKTNRSPKGIMTVLFGEQLVVLSVGDMEPYNV